MVFHLNLREEGFFQKRKILKDLRKILKENDLKRQFWTLQHPFKERYVRGDVLMELSSNLEDDMGLRKQGMAPYLCYYTVINLEMLSGSRDHPVSVSVDRELSAYYNAYRNKRERQQ